jgi:hypothetical protein
VGAILTNYVAAVYLKMNASASANLGRFHSRLVDTHQVLFGDLIASRIDDHTLRNATFSQMAISLAKTHSLEPKEETSTESRPKPSDKPKESSE